MSRLSVSAAVLFDELELMFLRRMVQELRSAATPGDGANDFLKVVNDLEDKLAYALGGVEEARATLEAGPTEGCDCDVCTAMREASLTDGGFFNGPLKRRCKSPQKQEPKSGEVQVPVKPTLVWSRPGGSADN